jgi:hypothetical protein
LYPTLGSRQSPFWKDGRNILFEDAAVKSSPGSFLLFDSQVGEEVTGIKTTVQGGKKTVYYGTPTQLKKWSLEDGVTDLTKVGGYTGTADDLWSFARWGEWIVASNGVDPIQVDKNAGAGFVDLTGTPFTWAKVIYGTDTQLFAMNTSNDPGEIAFCDIDDIESWSPLPSNQAGAKIQRNLASGITCAVALGANIAAYTEYEMIIISYIGTPFVYSILPREKGVGTNSKNGVISVGSFNYGFSKTGIWITDGATVQHIDDPAMHSFILGQGEFKLNKNKDFLVCAWHDRHQKTLTFYYPAGTAVYNSIGVVFSYTTEQKCWSICDFGRTCVDDAGIFDFAITGDRTGAIGQQNVDGQPFQSGAADPGIVDLTNADFTIEWDGYGEDYGGGDYGGGELDGSG